MTFQGNIDALTGREVFGSDGRRIGKVGQIFVLEGTDQPTWLTVHTGLFGTHETFVPMEGATERGDELLVPYEKAFVHDAPRIDDASDLTVEHEAELYRYYGVQPPAQQAGLVAEGALAGTGALDDRDGRPDPDAHRDRDELDRDRDGDGQRDDRDSDRDGIGASNDSVGGATGAPRIRRRIVTEMQTIQVPVQREEIIVEGEGIDGGDADRDRDGRIG